MAPVRAQQQGGSWWKGKGREGEMGDGEREKALVRVLSGQDELANLTTPKVRLNTLPKQSMPIRYLHDSSDLITLQGILITGPPGEPNRPTTSNQPC